MSSDDLVDELLDYILGHSIDIDEYFSGECEKNIYNERENKLEKGKIYYKSHGHKKEN